MLGSLHPTITISKVSDDTWTFKTATHVKTTEFTFKLGEEFEETSVDGRLCKVKVLLGERANDYSYKTLQSVLTFEDGKLKLVQHATKQGERDTEITREVVGNQLIMVDKKFV